MDDRLSEGLVIMDLDLNHEPLEPPVGSVLELGSLLNELETTHGRIEERIRQLEAVTARARQRQRWRQDRNSSETSNFPIEMTVDMGAGSGLLDGDTGGNLQERVDVRDRNCKRDSTLLVAKALELESVAKMVSGDGGNFFDCNICLRTAREPILTCCGHLFCWACFYELPYADSTAKECPVCKGEVTDTNVTPIYGNGNTTSVTESESGLQLPPRPRAHRIESVRQQQITWGVSHIPVAEALRRIRTGISGVGETSGQQDPDSVIGSMGFPAQVLRNAEAGSSRRLRSRQFSRVLSESAASLSSISSALNNAERLVDDLEVYIHDHLLGRSRSQFLPFDGGDSFARGAAAMQSESQLEDSSTENNSMVPNPASSGITDVSVAVVSSENLASDPPNEFNLTVPQPPSSSGRRSGVSRTSDVENGVSREHRRRRLR